MNMRGEREIKPWQKARILRGGLMSMMTESTFGENDAETNEHIYAWSQSSQDTPAGMGNPDCPGTLEDPQRARDFTSALHPFGERLENLSGAAALHLPNHMYLGQAAMVQGKMPN